MHMPQFQTGNGHLVERFQKDAVFAAVGFDILNQNVPEHRHGIPDRAILIHHGAMDGGAAYRADLAVCQYNLLHHPAPPRIALEPQCVGQVGTAEPVTAGHNPAQATAHFAAQRNTAMSARKIIVADQHIAAGGVGNPPVPVPAGFQADTVVTGIEEGVLNQHTFTAFRVASIGIRPVGHNMNPLYGHAAAQHRVQVPHGAVLYGKALQHNPLTADQLNKIGAQIVSVSQPPLLYRRAVHVHTAKKTAGGGLQVCAVG